MFDKLFDKKAIKELLDANRGTSLDNLNKVMADRIVSILNTYPMPKIKTKHDTRFIYSWNNYHSKEKYAISEWRKEEMVTMITRLLMIDVLKLEWMITPEECLRCGHFINYTFTEQGITLSETEDKCLGKTRMKRKITFKTGDLVVADDFAYENELFRSQIEEGKFHNINITAEIKKITDLYFSKNVVRIQVGNSSPSVYKSGNTLTFGRSGVGTKVGKVCTDIWSTMVVDRADLMEICLKAGMTESEAKEKIKASADCEIKVKPGTYEVDSDDEKTCIDRSGKVFFTIKRLVKQPKHSGVK